MARYGDNVMDIDNLSNEELKALVEKLIKENENKDKRIAILEAEKRDLNIKFEEVSHAVSWSISDSSLGSFSDSSAKETVFTAEATGTGTIKLSCEGYFVTADITIS